MKQLRPLLGLLLLGAIGLRADEKPAAPPAEGPKHWLIVLRLAPRLHDEKAWTQDDYAAVNDHFQRLKAGVEKGEVILAGRTEEPPSTKLSASSSSPSLTRPPPARLCRATPASPAAS